MARSTVILLTILALASLSRSAAAQVRGFTPPGGAVLPNQLEFFRPQSGVLDQYNQFVAPRENLANQLRAISAQQNRDYQAVQNRLQQSDMIRESEAAVTGTSAGFMNYSHYFGSRGGAGGGGGSLGQTRRISLRPYSTANSGISAGYGVGASSGIGSGFGGAAGLGSGSRFGR